MSSSRYSLNDVNVRDKWVLVRVDINVPFRDGKVLDDTRIRAIRDTVVRILSDGGRVVLASHFGRPGGKVVAALSLRQLLPCLESVLGEKIAFCPDILDIAPDEFRQGLGPERVILLENLRFYPGETDNDPQFSQALSRWGDIYCNDAFAVSHRAHASTVGVTACMRSCAGLLLESELEALEAFTTCPDRPLLAIVGGAKISTKIRLLGHLTRRVDFLFIGGGMANTFYLARRYPVGRSLVEPDHLDDAREIESMTLANNCRLVLSPSVVTAAELKPGVETTTVLANGCRDDHMILDTGYAGMKALETILRISGSVIWNGPIGAFETPPFDQATLRLARYIGELTHHGLIHSLAGGGETIAAISRAGVTDEYTHLSTGGGAFLAFMQGIELPGIKSLARD